MGSECGERNPIGGTGPLAGDTRIYPPDRRAVSMSAQTVWKILEDEGFPRLARRDNTRRGTPHRLEAVKAAALDSWPAGTAIRCDHAGLLLLFPAMVTLRLPELIGACGYPSTSQLSSWQSL